MLSTKLVENPVPVDLNNFLTNTGGVAATAAMFGIGLLHMFVNASKEQWSEHDTATRTARNMMYHNVMDDISTSVVEQHLGVTEDMYEQFTRPHTLTPPPPPELRAYAAVLPFTNVWTIGLYVAQSAAACRQTTIANLLMTQATDKKPQFDFLDYIYLTDYLILCGAEETKCNPLFLEL